MSIGWKQIVENEDVGDEIPLCVLNSSERIYRRGRSLVVKFPDKNRRVLSSANMNGGIMESPDAVVNTTGIGGEAEMELMSAGPDAYEEYSRLCISKTGVDPNRAVGLGTAVTMDKAAIVTKKIGVTEVTAIVTAGVEGNGGRAGDPASYDQSKMDYMRHGTIVTILLIEANVPDYTLARAIITAAEAKACALQQLMARSVYSNGIASGSGTDQIAVVCDTGNPLHLTDAGKHSVLGELIGKCVLEAVLKALDNWAGLNPVSQRNALKRLKRYGVTIDTILETIGKNADKTAIERVCADERTVAAVAAAMHLEDEIGYELLTKDTGYAVASDIIHSEIDPDYKPTGNIIGDLTAAIASASQRGNR